ncbi:MAG: tRNA epoxyqueuosine(34) reductase QueG [Thiohalomonadaceae bacterium]
MTPPQHRAAMDYEQLADAIRRWGRELGFRDVGIAGVDLPEAEAQLFAWLAQGRHGDMEYMARHGTKRSRPAELLPGTVSIICARMDYWPEAADARAVLADASLAYVSRYALGRDYHKLVRARLARLAERIAEAVGPFGHRVFTDSAPVLEKPLAAQAGLGWRGRHTNLLARDGSWFFLGEIYTDLPLPPDGPTANHCGLCTACVEACPTAALSADGRIDARLCISYLTIEHQGAIPEPLRPLLGNRIYGCDDCQLVCPWNRFAQPSAEADFAPRHGLDAAPLVALFAWDEASFLARTEGSPIRRIGHERWLRNIAVALGNAPPDPAIVAALRTRQDHPSPLVREHVAWALKRQLAGDAAD